MPINRRASLFLTGIEQYLAEHDVTRLNIHTLQEFLTECNPCDILGDKDAFVIFDVFLEYTLRAKSLRKNVDIQQAGYEAGKHILKFYLTNIVLIQETEDNVYIYVPVTKQKYREVVENAFARLALKYIGKGGG